MQGVIKAYDPASGDGVIMCDSDLADYELAPGALDGSIFRMLRQGQRVLFEVDGGGRATKLHLGSERDMETPGH
jgi:CspA family cold shock protein